jgi:multidrug efflux pump subunit AcrA (membrane-fusion protein)
VSGKVLYLHPNLQTGSMIPANTEVLRIEDLDYQLALKQAEANLVASQANLKEIELTLRDTRTNLTLAQKKLDLAKNELARINMLKSKGSVSQSNVDAQSTVVLQLQQEVQNLENQLATLPSKQDVQVAQVQISEASVTTQLNNLERTRLKLPFNARINSVEVEEGQFVTTGTALFSAQNIDKVKINAQFSLSDFRILAKGFDANRSLIQEAFSNSEDKDVFQRLGLQAKVQLAGQNLLATSVEWQGDVERITGTLDPSSRTLGVTISVVNPYENVIPGVRPPLLSGMYTRITLTGTARPYYVLPRDSLHQNELFLSDANNTLQRVDVKEPLLQGEMVLLESGLSPDNKLITSDLFPAVQGMALAPVLDTARQNALADWVEAHQ